MRICIAWLRPPYCYCMTDRIRICANIITCIIMTVCTCTTDEHACTLSSIRIVMNRTNTIISCRDLILACMHMHDIVSLHSIKGTQPHGIDASRATLKAPMHPSGFIHRSRICSTHPHVCSSREFIIIQGRGSKHVIQTDATGGERKNG